MGYNKRMKKSACGPFGQVEQIGEKNDTKRPWYRTHAMQVNRAFDLLTGNVRHVCRQRLLKKGSQRFQPRKCNSALPAARRRAGLGFGLQA